MANKLDNLIPFTNEQDREEAKKNGIKGGIASGEARRRKKQLRENLITLLETGDTQNNMCLEIIAKALGGDVRAFEVIRDTIGEKPTDKIDAVVGSDVTIKVELDNEE